MSRWLEIVPSWLLTAFGFYLFIIVVPVDKKEIKKFDSLNFPLLK